MFSSFPALFFFLCLCSLVPCSHLFKNKPHLSCKTCSHGLKDILQTVYFFRTRKKEEGILLQLGLEASLLLGSVQDRVQLGGHHDGTLDLDLARHEELLAVGLALGKSNKVVILQVDGDIRLLASDDSLVHLTVTGLEVEGPGGYFFFVGDLASESTRS